MGFEVQAQSKLCALFPLKNTRQLCEINKIKRQEGVGVVAKPRISKSVKNHVNMRFEVLNVKLKTKLFLCKTPTQIGKSIKTRTRRVWRY